MEQEHGFEPRRIESYSDEERKELGLGVPATEEDLESGEWGDYRKGTKFTLPDSNREFVILQNVKGDVLQAAGTTETVYKKGALLYKEVGTDKIDTTHVGLLNLAGAKIK